MSRITINQIIKAVSDKTGVRAEYISLLKCEGFYYWGEKSGSIFTESCTYIQRLSDKSLEYWVADFESKIKESLRYDYSGIGFNEYIESIDWEI